MFSKISRYRQLPDVVTIDAGGRSLQSKSIRLLPPVTGSFLHTVAAGDRLDHLAYKYYGQPRKWWRIADANPQFLSPLALLGHEPVVTDHFPLVWPDDTTPPPWAAARQAVTALLGVIDLQVVEGVEVVEATEVIGGEVVTVFVDHFRRALSVTYNEMNVGAAAIAGVLSAAGFEVGQPVRRGRVGKAITIPPGSTIQAGNNGL